MSAIKVKLVGNPSYNQATLTKAFNTANSMDLVKALPSRDLKAYFENPIRFAQSTNYKEKPTSLTYNTLYQMSVKNSVVAAVINTRVNQVSMFTSPARFSSDKMGYSIKLRDPNKIPTKEQQEVMTAIELFLENTGFTDSNNRDDFDTFIRKLTRDSLTYDQACFEIIPDRKGKPAEFVAVDAATIRAATEDYQPVDLWNVPMPKKSDEVKWVQIIDGNVVSWFTANELAFGVRNPRTNINIQPYGFSELEQVIQQITSHLYAEEYNSKFFSQGGTTKGIINIKADPNGIGNTQQLESFKRQWRAQVNGMTGAWKTPILQIPDGVEYVNVSQSNRDMEFSQWMNYLVNIVCAIYQIDPAEINFSNNGGAAGSSSVFETSQEQKLKHSKDKGLKPLLRFIETLINKFIVSKFSQDYVFKFEGLDEQSAQEQADLESKNVKVWKTVNEIRKEHGEEPLEHGDVILDSSFLNYIQQQQNNANIEEGMEGDMLGEEGEEGEDDNLTDYSKYLDFGDDEDNEEQENSQSPEQSNTPEITEEDEEVVEKAISKLIITLDD